MSYDAHKQYAYRILRVSELFSYYYQKKIVLASYNNFKTKKGFHEITTVYENWFTTHNINF